jgi:hypothetical protein
MASKKLLILRRLATPGTARRAGHPGGGLEGRTELIQLIVNSFTTPEWKAAG